MIFDSPSIPENDGRRCLRLQHVVCPSAKRPSDWPWFLPPYPRHFDSRRVGRSHESIGGTWRSISTESAKKAMWGLSALRRKALMIYIYIYRSAKTQEFSSWGALVEASDLFFPFWPVRLAETWLPTQHSGSQHPELHCGVLSPRFVDQQVPK